MALAILHEHRPEQRWTHVDGDNVFIAARYSPTLAVVHAHGVGGRPMCETIRESLSTILGGDQVVFYWDVFDLRSFDSSFREAVNAQLIPGRKRLRAIPLLVGSPVIAMAAAATNITLGGLLRVFRTRAAFEADLRRDLAQVTATAVTSM
jgi:hypothetical protein